MLSEKSKKIIKDMIPLLEQKADEITKHFYNLMLSDKPELLNIFNKSNITPGYQPTSTVPFFLAAAKHMDDLSQIVPVVREIGYKHRALQVRADQYPLVGKYLLKTLEDLLHPEKEVIDAWGEAYQLIADVFIQCEKELFEKEIWKDWAKFTVIKKEKANEKGDFYAFTVKNEEVLPDTSKIHPGEYITIRVKPKEEDHYSLRHYSICGIEGLNKGEIMFAVKIADKNGHKALVSHYLCDELQEGDTIEISSPCGNFLLDFELIHNNEIPLVLISTGSGLTPLLCMLERQVKENKDRPIIWIQSNKEQKDRAFKEQVDKLLSCNDKNINIEIFTQEGDSRINLDLLKKHVTKESDVYLCGGIDFMKDMFNYMYLLQVKRVHHDSFGPIIL